MVKELKRANQTFYVCEECGFAYAEKEWAEKCQAWDAEHHTCNIEIIQHGTPLEENA